AAAKRANRAATADTFKAVAAEWLATQRPALAAVTAAKAEWLLSLVPTLDPLPLRDITPPLILAALRRIEGQGRHETARRVK
ncbi:hypothetical protein ABTM87_19900, partial [Acinetobacter baumannii]